jgi:hypothetical protein
VCLRATGAATARRRLGDPKGGAFGANVAKIHLDRGQCSGLALHAAETPSALHGPTSRRWSPKTHHPADIPRCYLPVPRRQLRIGSRAAPTSHFGFQPLQNRACNGRLERLTNCLGVAVENIEEVERVLAVPAARRVRSPRLTAEFRHPPVNTGRPLDDGRHFNPKVHRAALVHAVGVDGATRSAQRRPPAGWGSSAQ